MIIIEKDNTLYTINKHNRPLWLIKTPLTKCKDTIQQKDSNTLKIRIRIRIRI